MRLFEPAHITIMKNLILSIIFSGSVFFMQGQSFVLSGKVELRNWKLSNRAMKSGTVISNALIELKNTTGVIFHTQSDSEGNFNLNIPTTGEFTMTINSPGQNPKKYLIISKGTSGNNNDANFRPMITISGMLTEKHKAGMNYLGFEKANVTVENSRTLPRATINDGEYFLIQKFCTASKLGDMALEKKNYDLAKTFYTMAMEMIAGEAYPKDQLKKAEEGLKSEKASAKKQLKTKQSKVKSAIVKQKSASAPSKNSESKNSGESGKAGRKIRKTL